MENRIEIRQFVWKCFFSIVYPKSFSNWKYDFDSTYYDKNTSKLTRKRKIFYTKVLLYKVMIFHVVFCCIRCMHVFILKSYKFDRL